MIELLLGVLYLIIGIGYAKTLAKLDDFGAGDFCWWLTSMICWPLFLVGASFWNFK
ncbi:ATPase [Escherichia phage UPEC01]|uniref:Uncharacterized protein n=1 Tax=Shigella phage SP18 TaxID=645664 RepID=E3SFH6_BPSP8|nr:hypothetical protein SP18_gp087 [Shigella phage SP18]ADO19429.1 hypothetical protein SP18gp087 [Shigella phage SP18]QQG30821.1 ATPase [Escherichia phage UPEC01]